MKKIAVFLIIKLSKIISTTGLFLNLPVLVAISWYITLRPYKYIKYKKNYKRVLVLGKSFGIEDFYAAFDSVPSKIKFYYLSRAYIKDVYENFLGHHNLEENSYELNNTKEIILNKKKCELFFKEIIYYLNKIHSFQGIISFNFKYHREIEFQKSITNSGLKFLSCHKESLLTNTDIEIYKKILTSGIGKYSGNIITVYNKLFQKLLLDKSIIDKKNIVVTGMPRADSLYKIKNNKLKKNYILILLFDQDKGFQNLNELKIQSKNKLKGKNWSKLSNDTLNVVLKIASKYKNYNFVFKSKVNNFPGTIKQINLIKKNMLPNCKIITSGSGIELIKNSSAVIGFNTTGIIESAIINKPTIVPLINLNFNLLKNSILKLDPSIHYYPKTKKNLQNLIEKVIFDKLPIKRYKPKKNDYVDYYIGNIDGKSGRKLRNVIYGLFLNKIKI